MKASSAILWNGDANRELNVYRPCHCGICSAGRRGVRLFVRIRRARARVHHLDSGQKLLRRLKRSLGQLRKSAQMDRTNKKPRGDERKSAAS